MEEIALTISLEFGPGLFDVLQAAPPPTVQYFKDLPTDTTQRWAVYLLSLEKPGCGPKVYIGSGTDSKYGVKNRFSHYDSGIALPFLVEKTLKEGYTIVHKGLPCWTSIPSAALQPGIRLLFLALEATFTYIFWAMRTVNKDYGMSHICLWDSHTLEWDSLCSHCCLIEGIREGDFELSAEELEAQAIQRKENRATKQAARNSNYHVTQMETNLDEYREKNLARVNKRIAKDPENIRKRERVTGPRTRQTKPTIASPAIELFTPSPT